MRLHQEYATDISIDKDGQIKIDQSTPFDDEGAFVLLSKSQLAKIVEFIESEMGDIGVLD